MTWKRAHATERFHRLRLARALDPMLQPWSDDVTTLQNQAQERIAAAWQEKSQWPVLCQTLNAWHYDLGNIASWPCDICHIGSPAAGQMALYLGSLAAARSVHTLEHDSQQIPVRFVLSFCEAEMRRVRGQPEEGWKQYFATQAVVHLSWAMSDVRSSYTKHAASCEQLAQEWWMVWMDMCQKLFDLEANLSADRRTVGVLFHCFGGIQRSSGSLCAWLILRHGLTPLAALGCVLRARPSLWPWQHRDHIFWALCAWHKQRDQLREQLGMLIKPPQAKKRRNHQIARRTRAPRLAVREFSHRTEPR